MAHIYLRHPKHGEKVESSDIIAQMDIANGWEEFDPHLPKVPSFLTPKTPIPDDFPGRQALVEAGFTTLESIDGKTADELQEVKGIGQATALRILDALE